MMVAWHEMPGKQAGTIRPVGNGMIRRFRQYSSPKTIERSVQPDHTVPSGTGFPIPRYQAFHARLLSFDSYGTIRLRLYGDATVRLQNSNTPTLQYSIVPSGTFRGRGRARRISCTP